MSEGYKGEVPRVDGPLPVKDTDTWMEVDAQVLGTLAVHRCRNALYEIRYGVTHTCCGLSVTHVRTEADAQRIAEHLWRTYRQAFEQTDHKQAARLIPQHVKDWCGRCRTAGHWVDPTEET